MAVSQAPIPPALPLQPAAFLQKWNLRFRTNDSFEISEADLREQARDLVELLGQLASRRGAPLVLSVLDELATVNQNFLVVGQGARVANATDSAAAAAGFEAGELEFVLRKDSTGPLWAFVNAKPETTQRVRVRWLPVGNPAERPEFLPPLLDEDDPHAAGDAVKFTFENGQTIPLEVRRAIPLPGAGLFNPVPTGHPTDDPNYLPLAPLVSALPAGQGFTPQQLAATTHSESQIHFEAVEDANNNDEIRHYGTLHGKVVATDHLHDEAVTADKLAAGLRPGGLSNSGNPISSASVLAILKRRMINLVTYPDRPFIEVTFWVDRWSQYDYIYPRTTNLDVASQQPAAVLLQDGTVISANINGPADLRTVILSLNATQLGQGVVVRYHFPSLDNKPVRLVGFYECLTDVPAHPGGNLQVQDAYGNGTNSGGALDPTTPTAPAGGTVAPPAGFTGISYPRRMSWLYAYPGQQVVGYDASGGVAVSRLDFQTPNSWPGLYAYEQAETSYIRSTRLWCKELHFYTNADGEAYAERWRLRVFNYADDSVLVDKICSLNYAGRGQGTPGWRWDRVGGGDGYTPSHIERLAAYTDCYIIISWVANGGPNTPLIQAGIDLH
ncbi:hypothetical protein [Hymenobacter psychrotolerans]|uniref:Uncharacterized protein n=1 Tax=Hymenobacter psychrotolerans DSM 18569 TaxID=1121959 RepID=A0A1M7E6G7_9BACT|nr:hypothetical protein [Hymenobacter psychrotolerans]SHL87334.1 hypothetical protein SAMN02746009_03532 [Hymenobacter psychrotolerans DSM 18569]